MSHILSSNSLPAVFLCSCYLRTDTHFIWVIISPVILIFLANIGFSIMTACVIWHHPKKENRQQDVHSWLKFAMLLPAVMGLNWVPGLFVVKHKGVIPLAYISTFLVASQGIFILLIVIIFFEPVRTAYVMWWKSTVRKSKILRRNSGNSVSLKMVSNCNYNILLCACFYLCYILIINQQCLFMCW